MTLAEMDNSRTNQPMHRLRIGLVGLVTVAFLTATISVISGRVSDEAPIDEIAKGPQSGRSALPGTDGNNEPLVDLGVVPDLKPIDPQSGQPGRNGAKQAAGDEMQAGQVVPDLKPKSNIANDPQ